MSIKDNFPLTSPSLSLDFANTKVLDPRITFSRPTSAVAYDGQTVTKAEENLLSYSQLIAGTGWMTLSNAGTLTATTNNAVAPDGTTTATTLDFPEVSVAGTYSFTSQQFSATNDAVYIASVYLRGAVGGEEIYIALTTFGLQIVLSRVTLTTSWQRFTIELTANTTGVRQILIGNDIRYGGATSTLAQTVYAWGAQAEQRSSVTAYTPTTTQPITNYIPTLLTAPANEARFDHNPVTGESLGLLVEEQRTNLVTYSEDFSNASWEKNDVTIQSNVIIAPDGTLTGALLDDASASFGAINKLVLSLANSAYYFSVYIKSTGVATNVRMDLYTTTGEQLFVVFNSATGAYVSGSAVIYSTSSIGNGWYRIALSATGSGTTFARIYPAIDSAGATGGIYIWGAQLEAGAFPTSYIKTEASQVTRSADSASMTGANFSDWYRQDEGTLYTEAKTSLVSLYPNPYSLSTAQLNSQNAIYSAIAPSSHFVVRINNVTTVNIDNGTYTNNVYGKTAGAYKVNDFAASLDGNSVTTDTAILLPSTPLKRKPPSPHKLRNNYDRLIFKIRRRSRS
jgi:hypothetical protein